MDLVKAREILIQHSKSKLNGQFPVEVTHESKLTNPICGDRVHMKLKIHELEISEIGFATEACAICTASTSLMCEELRGKTLTDARSLADEFENQVLAPLERPWPLSLEPFRSFEHLKVNHARRACALLPWVALKSALNGVSA